MSKSGLGKNGGQSAVPYDPSYIWQRLQRAFLSLASGRGRIRQRLVADVHLNLDQLEPALCPEELADNLRGVMATMTKVRCDENEGTYRESLKATSIKNVADLAERIVGVNG
jgi:hypothetical protein